MNHPVIEVIEESLYLEDLLADECKCESFHEYVPCSFKVTHQANGTCEHRPVLICSNVAAEHFRFISLGGLCTGCKRYAKDCWKIVPV